MKKIFLVFFILILALGIPLTSLADTITVRADSWMPYTGEPGDRPGYCVEIFKTIFEAAGYTVDYQAVAWTRAVADVSAGTIDAILGGDNGDCPSCLFPTESIGKIQQTFYVKKGNPWKFAGLESLKGQRLGVVDGYSYDKGDLDGYIKKGDLPDVQKATGDNALPLNIKKLLSGRLDIVVEENQVMKMNLTDLGLSDDSIAPAGMVSEASDIFVAFAPGKDSSKKYMEIWNSGLRKLRASGKLAEILARYGLTDWKSSE
ncbi:MAG: transporter substrate-binding domain-containing protein [Candidatus Omnitrophica bacterium]|nr:transporter substrate-binding domain-containing protein [Candidatus Omnitrophota bacterium]